MIFSPISSQKDSSEAVLTNDCAITNSTQVRLVQMPFYQPSRMTSTASFAREGGYLRGRAICTVGGKDRVSVGNGRAGEAKVFGQVLFEVQTTGENRCSQRDATFYHWLDLEAFFIDRLAHSAHGRSGHRLPEIVVCALMFLAESIFAAVGVCQHPVLIILGTSRRCRESVLALGGDRFLHRPCAHNQLGLLNQARILVVQA